MRAETDVKPPRRLPRAAMAFGALGLTTAAALTAVWAFRTPIVSWALERYLADRSVAATFEVEKVEFSGVTVRSLDLGPDAEAALAQAQFSWSAAGPRLSGLVLEGVRARGSLDGTGLQLGVLDRLRPEATGRPFEVPAIAIDLRDVSVQLETPQGLVTADLAAQGRLRGPMTGTLAIRFAPFNGAASATTAALSGDLAALSASFSPATGSVILVSGTAKAPWSLDAIEADLRAQTAAFSGFGIEAEGLTADLSYRGGLPVADSDAVFGTLSATAQAQILAAGPIRLTEAEATTRAPLSAGLSAAPFTLTAAGARGLGFQASAARLEGAAAWSSEAGLELEGAVRLTRFGLTPGGEERVQAVWVRAQGTPLEPLSAAGLRSTLGALRGGDLEASFVGRQEAEGFTLRFGEPIRLSGGSGLAGALIPMGEAATLTLGTQAFRFVGDLEFGGAALRNISAGGAFGGAWRADGTLAGQTWSANGAGLRHGAVALSATGGQSQGWRLAVSGEAVVSGPVAGGVIEGLQAPLRLELAFPRAGGVRITQAGACAPLRFARLSLPTVQFEEGALAFCPSNGVVAALSPGGGLSGGFALSTFSLAGFQGAASASLSVTGLQGTWSGTTNAPALQLAASDVAYGLAFAQDRVVTTRAETVTAEVSLGSAWSVIGGFTGLAVDDPAGAVLISEGNGAWRATPEGASTLIVVTDASALVQDRAPAGTDPAGFTPRFNALRIADAEARLLDGDVTGEGAIALASNGRALGRFTAAHDLTTAEGTARIEVSALSFDDGLQPLQISEFARGAIIRMEGQVDGVVDAAWSGAQVQASGESRYAITRLALPAVPDIRAVTGSVQFDDLLSFSTPPGQEVRLGVVNPGVALEDGVVRYQLLAGGRIAVEEAHWDFASGALTLEPTVIALGGGRTDLLLRLSAVDAGAAVRALQIKDLLVEGEVEGVFPVRLSPSAAVIENGILQATAPGRLAYTGPAAEGMGGLAQIAFDALRDFRYRSLTATLNGDLAGDIDVDVQLDGLHMGEDLDLSEIVPLPGARATADDVPFAFDISIHAPFRELVDTGAGINDARRFLDRALEEQRTPPRQAPLDPPGGPSP